MSVTPVPLDTLFVPPVNGFREAVVRVRRVEVL